jgi:4'-phosphopantetheinyl transferase
MIRWLIQTSDHLPTDLDWLSQEERLRFNAFTHAKRRGDWLLGRWTAKQLAARALEDERELREIVILSAADGSPAVSIGGKPMFSLSISHSNRHAFCALVDEGALGVDIEQVAPRIEGFAEDYFTAAEQALVAQSPQRDLLVTAIWSVKEAALKTLRLGLSVDTRAVTCRIEPGSPLDWQALAVEMDTERVNTAARLRGWWRTMEGFVLTLVTDGQQTPDRSMVS